MVKIFHVMLPRRLQIEEHRRIAPHKVKRLEIDIKSKATGNRGQMHDTVGRATNGQQYAHCVLKRFRRKDLVNGEPLMRHLYRKRSRLFTDTNTVCGHCGR